MSMENLYSICICIDSHRMIFKTHDHGPYITCSIFIHSVEQDALIINGYNVFAAIVPY